MSRKELRNKKTEAKKRRAVEKIEALKKYIIEINKPIILKGILVGGGYMVTDHALKRFTKRIKGFSINKEMGDFIIEAVARGELVSENGERKVYQIGCYQVVLQGITLITIIDTTEKQGGAE